MHDPVERAKATMYAIDVLARNYIAEEVGAADLERDTYPGLNDGTFLALVAQVEDVLRDLTPAQESLDAALTYLTRPTTTEA